MFRPTKQEAYVWKRLKQDHGATVDLDATASIRRERIRIAICDYGLRDQVCLMNRAGEQMTYGETYHAMYGEQL